MSNTEGEGKRVSRFDHRFYQDVDGAYYPSTTTVISKTIAKPGLNNWYKEVGLMADILMNKAADRGSRVHDAIDTYIKTNATVILQSEQHPNYTEKEISQFKKNGMLIIMRYEDEFLMVERAINLLAKIPFSKIIPEQHYISYAYGYAGTVDIVFELERPYKFEVNRTKVMMQPGLYILDWKTGNAYDDHPIQLASYAEMINEHNNYTKPILGAILAYIDAKTKNKLSVKYMDINSIEYNFQLFMDIKTVYDKLYAIALPSGEEFSTHISPGLLNTNELDPAKEIKQIKD